MGHQRVLMVKTVDNRPMSNTVELGPLSQFHLAYNNNSGYIIPKIMLRLFVHAYTCLFTS